MRIPRRHFAVLAVLWLLLLLIAIFSHSFIPIDETRYVTVAWNMWLSGDFLVPTLNGIAYSHKPPLLFWLMNLGWAVFGVSDWWPRVVPALFALGSVWLVMLLAARLWPQRPGVTRSAPVILFGCVLWTVFATATMFDMLLAFFALVGMLGVVIAWQGRGRLGWLLFAVAIGGGLLAKGPAIFLHVLPAALLTPWWGGSEKPASGRWYAGLVSAVVLGVAIALIWAIPAGLRGGEEYRQAIFWGQTAHRMVESFAHQRPFWWYLPVLPVVLFPWLLWPPLWQGAARLRQATMETGVRFCLAWLVPVFVVFSLVSGKQMHYLLPIFPAFALLAARALEAAQPGRPRDGIPVLLAVLAIAALLLYLPSYAPGHAVAAWLGRLPAWIAFVLALGGLALWLAAASRLLDRVWSMMLVSVLIAGLIHLGIIHTAGTAYDVRPIAARIKQFQDQGIALAHAGEYPGIFNFVGRLQQSPEIIEREDIGDWFSRHAEGRVIVYFDRKSPLGDAQAEFVQDYMGVQVGILDRRQWESWCHCTVR